MTERDVENLSKLPVPPPRANAKTSALEAALQVFDYNSAEISASPAEASQGNVRTLRQTETTQHKRSFRMPSLTRPQMALAASFAALLIVAPIAMHQLRQQPLQKFSPAVSEVRAPAKDGDVIAITEGKSAPEAPAPFANANVEERVAEMDATTARKGNRKTEDAISPPSNMPSEVAQGLGQSPTAVTHGQISLGKQSLAADNAALGTNSQATGSADAVPKQEDSATVAALAPPQPAPPATAYLAKPAAPVAA